MEKWEVKAAASKLRHEARILREKHLPKDVALQIRLLEEEADLHAETIDPDAPPHFRERARLALTLPAEDRSAVALAANRQVNLTGGRYSDAYSGTVAAYHRDPERFHEGRRRDAEDDQRIREIEREHIRVGLIDLDKIGL